MIFLEQPSTNGIIMEQPSTNGGNAFILAAQNRAHCDSGHDAVMATQVGAENDALPRGLEKNRDATCEGDAADATGVEELAVETLCLAWRR